MQQIYLSYIPKLQWLNRKMAYTSLPNSAIIEHRIKVIEFFDEYGREPTKKAFGVSRATVYVWKRRLKQAGGRLEALSPLSKAPRRRRQRQTQKILYKSLS